MSGDTTMSRSDHDLVTFEKERKRRGIRPPDLLSSFAEAVVYCGLVSALRPFPQFRRRGSYTVAVLVPSDAVTVYETVAKYALEAGSRWGTSSRVVALAEADPRRRKEKFENEVKEALQEAERVLIFASGDSDIPSKCKLMLDGIVQAPALTGRRVQAAARCWLKLRRPLPDEIAEEIARMPLEVVAAAFRKSRPWQASLAKAREALAVKDSPKAEGGDISLDDLHGMGEAGEWARELVIDLEDWRQGRIQWSDVDRGILLSGPPGTGKTTFAGALARSCAANLVLGSLSKWQSRGHMGDLLKAMYGAFAEAKSKAPSILFIDEVDAFGDRNKFSGDNAQYCTEVVNGFLEALDGLDGREGVVVIGACNHPQRLDPAIVRPGRLDRHVRIPLPDADGRVGILRWHTSGALPDDELREVAARTEGASGALLEQMVRQARRSARRERREMKLGDLLEQLPARVPVSPEYLWRTCVHEAGHATVGLAIGGWGIEQVLVVTEVLDNGRTERGGGVYWRDDMERVLQTRADYLDRIARFLGGMAAEEMIFGDAGDGAGGTPASDLHRATVAAALLEASVGLGAGLAYLAPAEEEELLRLVRADVSLRMRVDKVLAEGKARAAEILAARKPDLRRLAEALRDRHRLTGQEVREVLEGQPRLALVPQAS